MDFNNAGLITGLIDLHTHSTASDGSFTPSGLVRHAASKGLKAIAITDHDTLDGLPEALKEAEGFDIEVVPGVEISVDFQPEMHMLGYFLHGGYTGINRVLEELKEKRSERNPKIIKRLNELGMKLSMEEVDALAGGGITGRPHIARIMLEKGYVGSVAEAFDKYLGSGRPAYFRKEKLTPEQGIEEISKAGGLAVLAHPIFLDRNREELDLLLKDLAKTGLKGIEAYYTENTEDQTEELLELAGKHGLFVTGGSDFHGSFKPDIEIGTGKGKLAIGYELLEIMKRCG
jgi:predicted metal-dependent phosphoesterase TrpH